MGKTPLYLCLLFCAAWAQKDVLLVDGPISRIFCGKDGRTAVCIKQNAAVVAHILSEKMVKEASWTVTGNAAFLPNDQFSQYLAYAEMGPVDSAGGFQKIDLRFISLKTGITVPVRLQVKTDMPAGWVGGKDIYVINGKICRPSPDAVKIDRMSGTPFSCMSPNMTWCASAAVRDVPGGKNVNIELEEFATSDMIPVETYTLRQMDVPLLDFAADPRYLYYRSKENPAIYDLEQRRSLSVGNISYKNPDYFGYYMKDDDTFYFHDYFSVIQVDVKKFEVRDIKPNPYAESPYEILATGKNAIRGVLFKPGDGLRIYTKFFTYDWKREDARAFPLPARTYKAWLRKGKGCFLYEENLTLKYNDMELK